MLWLSAQQIAEAAAAGLLPGLPTTRRGVGMLAAREGWAVSGKARKCDGREGGGGLEYHIDLLPSVARAAWIGQHLQVSEADLRPCSSDGPVDAAADARGVMLRLLARFQSENALAQSVADALFCELFNGGSIGLPEWVTATVPSLSARTLARWRRAVTEGARAARRGRPKGSGVLDRAAGGAVRSLILAAIAKQSFLCAKHVRALVRDRFGRQLEVTCEKTGEVRVIALPGVRVFQIALSRWRVEFRNELMRLTDPDGYRSKVEFTATGSQRADRLNEMWQIDASPADVMLKGGRHSVYVAADVYSRRLLVLVSPTPRASAVGLLVRKCLIRWGVPECIKTDNGSDFIAHQTRRLFAALGIRVELSPPFQPKSKGIVERAIGTFQRDLAVCPGFIGHSVADRKVIEQRRAFNARLGQSDDDAFGVDMDIAEFQAWCDAWADEIYGQTPHSALSGRSPVAMAAGFAGTVRRIEHEAALDVLLAPIASGGGLRRVGKQGVRVQGALYLPMSVTPGREVLVRMDPADMGRIMLFDPETEDYLGEAINAGLAGVAPAEVVARAKAMQKAQEAEQLVDIRRSMRSLKPRDIVDALRRDASERTGIVAFPRPADSYSTPALAAAAEAAGKPRPAAPSGRVSDADHAAFVAAHAGRSNVIAKPDNPRERFRQALLVEERLARGEAVDEDAVTRLRRYQAGSEYRAHRILFDGHGWAMFG
jgi:transposase InsO family protein